MAAVPEFFLERCRDSLTVLALLCYVTRSLVPPSSQQPVTAVLVAVNTSGKHDDAISYRSYDPSSQGVNI
jgi:hypothetical protein